MQIKKDSVVTIHYQLHDAEGQEIDSSLGGDPMAYLHGHGNLIPGLERALEGATSGQHIEVIVPPEEAYGLRDENAIQRIPIKHLHEQDNLQPGQIVHVETTHGSRQVVVVKVGKFNIDADTNHPLAGLALHFKVDVVEVRDAIPEELQHGHAHGVGGHHH